MHRKTPNKLRSAGMYGLLAALLVGVGILLVCDLWFERARVLEDTALQAEHKSQILARSFGDTFLAADYVLRDILGHIDIHTDAKILTQMRALLKEKLVTVTGLVDLVVLDKDCVFRANAGPPEFVGRRSNQRYCNTPQQVPGESLFIQYSPPEQSANHKPSVVISRVVASPQGQMQMGAMAVISLDYAQQWISAFDTLEDDTLSLVDSEGVLLARKPHLASLGQYTPLPAGLPRFADIQGTLHFKAVAPTDQRTRVYGVSRLERVPFIVLVGMSEERALRNWRHRIWQFGLGYAFLMTLSLWLVRSHMCVLQQRDKMEHLATTDALTGIANRRQFMALAEHESNRSCRYHLTYTVVMLDIDHFKRINDQWGHTTGDRAICAVARVMEQAARITDHVARYGGEEFVLLLPETQAGGGAVIAERLRAMVEATTEVLSDDGSVVRFTVSIGVASRAESEALFAPVLLRADQALYQAKAQGRNRVCETEIENGELRMEK
jgi:diguanylate cyclase (GGDEF)-like protein